MTRRPLDADTLLSIHISTRMTRRRYDHDAAECITELEQVARGRHDLLLAAVAGFLAGYRDEHTERLCRGLLDRYPTAVDHPDFAEVARRRGIRPHGAP